MMAGVNEDLPYERAERRNARWTVVLAVLLYAASLALSCYAYGAVVGFVYSSPMLAALVGWVLVYRGGGLLWAAKWLALRRLDGARHYFDDRPIRIEWRDGRACIGAFDIYEVLHAAPPTPSQLRRLALQFDAEDFFQDDQRQWWFTEDALLRWLQRRGQGADRTTLRLERWLRHEALPALHRKAGRETTSLPPATAPQPSAGADPGPQA